jgi:hypothetical protein
MTKSTLKVSLMLFLGVAVVNAPVWSRAESTNSATRENSEIKTKHAGAPLHGKLKSLDTEARTLAIGAHTFRVTSETKITKNGQPAVFADGVIGEEVSVLYRKTEDGTLEALTVHFGPKEKAHTATNPAQAPD